MPISICKRFLVSGGDIGWNWWACQYPQQVKWSSFSRFICFRCIHTWNLRSNGISLWQDEGSLSHFRSVYKRWIGPPLASSILFRANWRDVLISWFSTALSFSHDWVINQVAISHMKSKDDWIKINTHASQNNAPQSTAEPSATDASVTGTASPTSPLSTDPTPTLSISSGASLTSSPTTTNYRFVVVFVDILTSEHGSIKIQGYIQGSTTYLGRHQRSTCCKQPQRYMCTAAPCSMSFIEWQDSSARDQKVM